MNNKPILILNLLGTVAIKLDDKPVSDITSRTAIAILIYLIHHRRPILRETLADFFWDGRSQKQAGANLRSALSRLRRKFPDHLIITRDSVAFNHDQPHQVDSLALEQELERLLKESQPDIFAIEESLTRYHGDFLAGFYINESEGFNNWAMVQREKLRRLTAIALQKVTAHHLTNGSYLHGIPFGERWVRIDPLDELAHQQLMWLLARAGRRHEALQKFEQCQQLLQNELSLTPSPATQKLQQRIRDLTFPPPLQLPTFTTPFIGRQIELNQLSNQLLTPDCPLLTILGMGGTGKSRLAAQVAKQIADQKPGRFLDGIFYVPLAAAKNGTDLITALIELFDLIISREDSTVQLLDHLANHEMLLVLDNFEQLADDDDALDLLTQLIAMNGDTRLLLTSRQRLFLQAEQVFPLGGLRYPNTPPTQDIDYEAGVLFVNRARRMRGNELMDREEMLAIWQICHAVEGSPIAIEMAAGSMWKMEAANIADQIKHGMTKLTTAMRDVPARHRSVQAVFNFSWNLLTPNEQQNLARLAVFPATFDAESAQAITSTTADRLNLFIARSLIRPMENGRFNLHPLVRQFAAEKLTGQLQARSQIEEKHARHFVLFTQLQGELFEAGKQKEALQAITRELDNVRTMWQWATQHKQFATLRQVAELLQQYFEIKGWFMEGREMFASAISSIKQEKGKAAGITQAALLTHHGAMSHRISDYAGSRRSLERALQLQEAYAAYCDTASTLGNLSVATELMDDSEASLAYIKRGLVVARDCHVPWQEAAFLNTLGVYHMKAGAYQTAVPLFQEAAIIQQEIQSWQWLAMSLSNLGACLVALGACEEAYGRLQAADEIAQRINYKIIQTDIEINKGWVSFLQGDFDKAAHYVVTALAIAKGQQWHQRTAEAYILAGTIAQNQADFATANEKFQTSLHFFQKDNYAAGIAEANALLGQLSVLRGELDTARSYLREAIKVTKETKTIPILPQILVGVAQLAICENEWETAVKLTASVKAHPSTTEHVRRQAQELWKTLADKLPSTMLAQADSDIKGVDLSAFLPKIQQWLNN